MRSALSKADQFASTKWSGGITTELFIYPEETSYSNRNFEFRLSTATVEVANSVFTKLIGVHRKLLLLDGKMTLKFNGESQESLGKFDVASFEGHWETVSEGTCRDFNLMTRGNFDGDVMGVALAASELIQIELEDDVQWLFIYNLKGSLSIIVGNKNFLLGPLELFRFDEVDFDEFALHSSEEAECVITQITPSRD